MAENRMLIQRKLLPFFLLFLLTPALHASPTSTSYPKNPTSNQSVECISDNSIKCYAAASQKLLWENHLVNTPHGMLLRGDKLYVNSDHVAMILNVHDGQLIAQIHNEGTLFDPVVTSGRLILSDQQGWIRVIDLPTMNTLWRRRIEQSWVYPPAVIGGAVITGGRDGVATALDLSSGEILWRKKIGQELVYRPVIAAGKIFISSFDGKLRSIDPKSGTIVAELQLDSPVFAIFPDLNEKLYAAGYDGNLYAINARNNSLLWNQRLADSLRFYFSVGTHEIASIDHAGNFMLIDKQTGSVIQHTRFEGRYQVSPLMTHSKIRLFPRGKPFSTFKTLKRIKQIPDHPEVKNETEKS